MDETLLSRVEDASLNASAPPQQRWLDGWLVRFSPGKAKRARCINAVAPGRMSVRQKLAQCEPVFRNAGLPLVVRITRFSQPQTLDRELATIGLGTLDDTRVLVNTGLNDVPDIALPPGLHWARMDSANFAETVGMLRGSPPEQRLAHAQRLAHSPVPYHACAIRRDDDGLVLACGQFALEAEMAGIYDVFTHESHRGRGLAQSLCKHLLSGSFKAGARVGYLQVEFDNVAARRIYARLGFTEGYRYHYRQPGP